MMKRIWFVLTVLLIGFGVSGAQTKDSVRLEKRLKEVQEYKMKYLAQEMELSEAQKKKFFELYEAMSAQKRECYSEAMKMDRELKHGRNASETDYEQVTSAFNKANAEWADIEKEYNEKFSEFLTQKQIYKMREADNNFRLKFQEMKMNRRKEKEHRRPEKK